MSFLMVLALSAVYVRYGGLPWMQGVFYGSGAAVIAIIGRSAYKLVRLMLGKDSLLWVLFVLSAVVTAWTETEVVWLFVLSGVGALVVTTGPQLRGRAAMLAITPTWLIAGLAGPAGTETLWKIALYFAEAGAFVFGRGLR